MSAWLYLAQQAACAWSLLTALGMCMGLKRPAPLRLLLTALLTGCMALACALTEQRIISAAALVLVTLLAPPAAWPGVPRSRRGPMAAACLLLTLLMAGCGRLGHALGLGGTPLIACQLVLLPLAARRIPRFSGERCLSVEVTRDGCRLRLTALVDSGNMLRDPLTRLPVIVISRRAAARLIPLPEDGTLTPGMRLISVRTVAGTSLMAVFRPQEVRLLLPGGWQTVHAMIGLSPDGYSGFQALLPSDVIPPSQGGTALCP